MHTTSPRPKICPLLLTTSQALFAKTFMHAIFHSIRAGSDGLGEVGSISTEMHVTPAERSEPGDKAITRTCYGLGEVGSISTEMQITPAERSEPGDCTPLLPSSLSCFEDARERANFQ